MAKFITYTYFAGNTKEFGNTRYKLEVEAQTPEMAERKTLLFRVKQLENKGFNWEWKGKFIVWIKDGKKGVVLVNRVEKAGSNKNLLFGDSENRSVKMASLVEILNKAFKALEQGHEVIIYKANNYFEISFINSGKINNSTEFKVLMKNTKTKQTKMGRFDRLSPQGAVNFISDFIKKSQKTQDKSPLSFMDSVVRAFRDEKRS